MKIIQAIQVVAALAASATLVSCDVNDYCLNCATDDAGKGSDASTVDAPVVDAPVDAGCVPNGPEVCDGEDNDCNGEVDDDPTDVGDPCANQMGECSGGVEVCAQGVVECSRKASPEICDFKDNNCNGTVDEGDPGGGGKCGTDQGECVAGTLRCQGFVGCNSAPNCTSNCCVSCDGFVDRRTDPESCNGRDDDCDGKFDEGLTNLGACTWPNATNTGECNIGTVSCSAGAATCSGAVLPVFELCDSKDNDCDGNTDEAHKPDVANHVLGAACDDGQQGACRDTGTYACNTGDPTGALVCSFTTSNPAPGTVPEDCNAKDDDCDGQVDEGTLTGQEWVDIGNGKQMMKYEASRPDATSATPGTIDSIVCSGASRLPWTNIKYADALAACQSIGASLCSESDWHRTCSDVAGQSYPATATVAAATLIEAEYYSGIAFATQPAAAESGSQCSNNTDDDADGAINDGCPAVSAAETACAGNGDEDADGAVNDGCPTRAAATRAWVPDFTTGYSAISAMEATPNTGGSIALGSVTTAAPRLDYQIDFTQTGAYVVWAKVYANSASDDLLHAGITGLTSQTFDAPASVGSWVWVRTGSTFTVSTTGARTVSIWMGDDGVKIDKIAVSTSTTAPSDTVASKGGTWAYASNPNTYQASVCNGADFDTSAAAGNQDDILATGSLASCRSLRGSDVFDMSGNVKEWTLSHQPGENPIRGGASNNTDVGISCALNFTLADDTFFFPNIGFRCCK